MSREARADAKAKPEPAPGAKRGRVSHELW